MRDAIVIGAGLSGLMGALALAKAGRRPLVLAKGHGSTHWISGTIDLLGVPVTVDLHARLQDLIRDHPDHIYARVGIDGIEEALDQFRALMEEVHYPYLGDLQHNVLLPTAIGALRPATLFPATMAAGNVQPADDLLIAGFRELRDFFPPLIAGNLRAQGFRATGMYLHLPPVNRQLEFTTRTFANLFDDTLFRQAVGKQLREARGPATHIGLPAVLGLNDPMGVVQELQEMTGARIFEIPTLPPSIPGMRLFNILRDAITHAGGRLQIGSEVRRAEGHNGRLTTVYTEAAARDQEHRASCFLLATGGIAGGGIRTDHTGAVRETALDLPLDAPTSRTHWFEPRFFHAEGHPIFESGVMTDGNLRPLDAEGQVVYANVRVAGSALAGADPIRTRSYSGLALTTGWCAGQSLA